MRLKLVSLAWLFLFLLLAPLPAAADEFPIVYKRYDTEITLQPNGNFIVREIQEIAFEGVYHTAFAEIPRRYTSNISHVTVLEGDKPYVDVYGRPYAPGQYNFEVNGEAIYVEWQYEETRPGDVRTFTLQYEVEGGLWLYPNETILEWRAVPADRSGFPVLASQVTVILPAEVPPGQLRYAAYGPTYSAAPGRDRVVFTSKEAALFDGTFFQVQVGFPPSLVKADKQFWQRQDETGSAVYRLEAVDVHLAIGADGRVSVAEDQRIAVDSGHLVSGYRTISRAYLDSISDVQVSEGEQAFTPIGRYDDCPESYCLTVEGAEEPARWIYYDDSRRQVVVEETQAGRVHIEWFFPVLVSGEKTTFRLGYVVEGALQVSDQEQRLNWTVISSAHEAPITSASLAVDLPPGLSWDQVRVQGGQKQVQADGSVRLVPKGPLPGGYPWQVSLVLPAGATAAPVPAWQQTLLAADAEAQAMVTWRARLALGAGIGGVLILVGGLLAALLAWSAWGRDRQVARPAEYLAEPPSALPPGIVAYLVDEDLTPKSVLASLFHLASLGLLRVEMKDSGVYFQCNWTAPLGLAQTLQLANGRTIAVPGHLVTLFNSILPHIPAGKTAPLYTVASKIQADLPAVYVEMGQEAAEFFTGQPDEVRHRWLSFGQWLALAGVAAAVIGWLFWWDDAGWVILAPPVALFLVGGVFTRVSRWMPRRSDAGAAEAARWRAFRQYLQNLKSYGSLAQAQKILDEHFAYAVALGVEDSVLAQAEALGGTMPAWTYPASLEPAPDLPAPVPDRPASGLKRLLEDDRQAHPPLRLARHQPGAATPPSDTPAPATAAPAADSTPSLPPLSLAGLSEGLGHSLASAGETLTDLLNQAAGPDHGDTPFERIARGAGNAASASWNATSSTMEVLGEILEEAASSGGGSGGYSSSSSSRSSSWSSSSSRSSGSSFSGRDSSSRRSGGGGRRGFG